MQADPRSVEMIRRLVSYDTTSRNSNLELIEWIRGYLEGFGVAAHLTYDDDGRKANLYATLGPADVGGVMLSGHTDVVPVDGQDWHTDPFDVVEKDGRLYGRGTCDMKSFVAVALAHVPGFIERGLKAPVHLAFSYDEEVGCIGVRRLIDQVRGFAVRPEMCVVGEPTDMKVVVAHKGKRSFTCEVRGMAAHSSIAPEAVNAVEYAAEIVSFIRRKALSLQRQGPFEEGFDPPHSTVHTGVMRGGTQLNIVPEYCMFQFEMRYLPFEDHAGFIADVRRFAEEELLPDMLSRCEEAAITFREDSGFPGLTTPEDADVTRVCGHLAASNETAKVSFGTEAGLFSAGGIPTVVCGPGSIAQAHKPDEFVTLEQVARCDAFMDRLKDRVCER
ncbi:MAG: acetylornithine deacetylase [Rhodospirillaceae bacterium]